MNNKDIKLNIMSLIINKEKLYSSVKKFVPLYWYTRPMTKFILKEYKKNNLIGAEIGVSYGLNAKTILTFLPIKKLYLIDPYNEHTFSKNGDERFQSAKKLLSKFGNKKEFIIKTSEEAADIIPNDLDFVYIDGRHEYEYVKKDIELYYSKVKKNGILGGHDFWASKISVCKAVLEFAEREAIKLHGDITDWWIIK